MPGLLGALVGAPLVARELEQRTHLLAGTQGVTRTRWLATKLAVLVPAIVILGIAFTALISWWRWPLDQLEGRSQPNSFDFEGLVPTAYTLCAFALGTFMGLLLRRTVPAMAVVLRAFFVIRYPLMEVLVRPHLRHPLELTMSPASFVRKNILASDGSWILNSGIQDVSGRHLRVMSSTCWSGRQSRRASARQRGSSSTVTFAGWSISPLIASGNSRPSRRRSSSSWPPWRWR